MKKKYFKARERAELSIQFYYSKREGCWRMILTVNDKIEKLSSMDATLFGMYLCEDEHLDKEDKLWLVKVLEGLKSKYNKHPL